MNNRSKNGMKFDLLKDPQSKAGAGSITTITVWLKHQFYARRDCSLSKGGAPERELKLDINPDVILGNTYHLYLRPQTAILESGWIT
jgi:queuine tRNA-ribosyltransferase